MDANLQNPINVMKCHCLFPGFPLEARVSPRKKNNVILIQSPDLYHASIVCFDTFIHMLRAPCELNDGGALQGSFQTVKTLCVG